MTTETHAGELSAPGPWAIDPLDIGTPWNIETADGATSIALAQQVHGDTRDQKKRTANARLIAAAPDLLAALARLLELCENGEGSDAYAQEQARAAIAKAKP